MHRSAQRTNIPTAELERFAEDDEKKPKTLLYQRDSSIDPQLVWKGKDEQDRTDLAVPAVPIYIQEKIHPRALIEELRAEAARSSPQQQIDLFGDFNGLELEKLVDFYQHSMKWQNRLILGDSLLVMASLAEKEGLRGKVQTIYIDPPYGIKFGSNWQVSTRKRDVKDGKAEDATRQPEQIKAFRDTWELGIHSYLTYMRDRLVLTRDLLSDTGSVFVQIGDENVHLVRALLDEVFGSDNFVSMISFTKAPGGLESTDRIASRLDYLLWYAKAAATFKYRPLYEERADVSAAGYNMVELADGSRRTLSLEEREDPTRLPPDARLFMTVLLTKPGPGAKYVMEHAGRTYDSGSRWWGMPKESLQRLIDRGRVVASDNSLRFVRYLDDFPFRAVNNLWGGLVGATQPIYVVQTNDEVIKRCLLMTTDPGDLVLDPTCGSGTTANVAEQWGRRWITIDTSRVALALTRTRMMAARYPYYLLTTSAAGIAKEAELAGHLPDTVAPTNDISGGFVYRRAPRITPTTIANNPDIAEGMNRQQIEAAVLRHAETELLYDRPYVDSHIVRVAGPFTVESLSPHRFVDSIDGDGSALLATRASGFVDRILQNLRKAGVQNTVKGERLVFDRLDQWQGGVNVHAAGEYTESGTTKTVAVCIGPEYGTVGQELVREAAKEAVKFADLLVVCGFAFEAHVGDEATKLGRLTILKARMNPDLSMADELLKKTGSGNLFMVFGEPDIKIEPTEEGTLTVEIRGVDTFDPTTGEIKSASVDEIACWFIDTEYNGESFFVRHAYFLGADDPYEKLKRALRAEIDEAGWSTLYRATSRPFPKPPTGRIAVKVINHYGDEVLKAYEVS